MEQRMTGKGWRFGALVAGLALATAAVAAPGGGGGGHAGGGAPGGGGHGGAGWSGGGNHGGSYGGGNGYHGGGNGYHGGYYGGYRGGYYGRGGYWGGGYYGAGYWGGGWGLGYYGSGFGVSLAFPYYGYPYYGGVAYPGAVTYTAPATTTYIYNDPAPVTYGNGNPQAAFSNAQAGIPIPPPASAQLPPVSQGPAQAQQYRFYCPDSGYYPQVQQCVRGWLQVVVPGGPATSSSPNSGNTY